MSNRHERRKRSYESDRERDSDSYYESKRQRTDRTDTPKARVMWVLRGQREVAAFSAINNPAVRIEGNRHKHRCSNCSTEYEHDHPYRKSEHPQHIKDCPKCRNIAPEDRPRSRMNASRYRSDYNNYNKYSNRNNRRIEPYRSRDNYRRRSRSRSPRGKNRDSSSRRPDRIRRRS